MKPTFSPTRRSGFTLIELVVTIAILSIVAVLVIPTIRILSKDRKVHDTANSVIAVFASARERAAVDGYAGVEIAPLINGSGGYNNPNMGMILYQLRAIPAYSGDTFTSQATAGTVNGLLQCDVLVPGDLSANGANIRPGDNMELNHSGMRHRIVNVAPPVLPDPRWIVTIQLGAHEPAPTNQPVAFRIFRPPVLLR